MYNEKVLYCVYVSKKIRTFAFENQTLQNLMAKIIVQNTNITIISVNGDDYFSLTALARYKSDEPNAVIANWMRNRNTIEYLGIWEQLYNPDFKPTEFEGFRMQAVFIEQGMTQGERLVQLNQIAIHQMSVLESGNNDRKLLK